MDDTDRPEADGPETTNGHVNGRGPVPAPPTPTTTPPQVDGQHSATQGVSAETPIVPAITPVVEPEAEAEIRPTVQVHADAPEADAAAITEHGCTWDAEGKHWRKSGGARMCGAHPLSPKGPCKQTSLYDNGRCHYHGGPTPRGIASANYIHGRWSKALNPTRAKLYEAARDDPELLDLRRTIGALDTGVAEAMERREKLDTPDFRGKAIELFSDLQKQIEVAPDDLDSDAVGKAMGELGNLLRRGAREDNANEEVARHVSRMSKHMETAWKIRLMAAHSVNDSDLMAIIGALIDVIVREVPQQYVGLVLAGFDREVLRGRLAQSGVDTSLR